MNQFKCSRHPDPRSYSSSNTGRTNFSRVLRQDSQTVSGGVKHRLAFSITVSFRKNKKLWYYNDLKHTELYIEPAYLMHAYSRQIYRGQCHGEPLASSILVRR